MAGGNIERAFGVLQAKFQFLARPFVLQDLKLIECTTTCCLTLHNMCVADGVMSGDVRARHNPAADLLEEDHNDQHQVKYPAELHHMREEGRKNHTSTNKSIREDSVALIGVRNASQAV